MTEKQYGGETGRKKGKVTKINANEISLAQKVKKEEMLEGEIIRQEDVLSYKEAGKIAIEVRNFAKEIIRPGMKLLGIAEQIESKIMELGGKPAFPVNLSINEIAAHYTPGFNDETLASGILKVDIGVHVNGCIADTAFSLDLENNEENKKLIEASEQALAKGLEKIRYGIEVREIGKEIQEAIVSNGFSPIRNLTGHQVTKYFLHAGISIPNYDNGNNTKINKGVYAIEPFVTNGQGIVYESKPSGIYIFRERKGVRGKLAKDMMDYILEEYGTLPFCSRWLIKKFGTRATLALKLLEQAGAVEQYNTLVEKGRGKVSQAEHTAIVFEDNVEIITR